MTYRKTAPVVATHVPDVDAFEDEYQSGKVTGSFRVEGDTFWYCCPCGCGRIGALHVGNGFKPDRSPSWQWNGSFEAPTLTPSINHRDHWHGFLTDGVWVSC